MGERVDYGILSGPSVTEHLLNTGNIKKISQAENGEWEGNQS